MEQKLKERIFGAVIVTSLVIIFVPMIFNGSSKSIDFESKLPTIPEISEKDVDIKVPNEVKTLVKSIKEDNLPIVETRDMKSVKQQNVAQKAYVVQLATFKSVKNANILIDKLKKQGLPAYSRKANGSNTQLIRVYVGPEIELEKVKNLQAQLKNKFNLDGLVVKYNPHV